MNKPYAQKSSAVRAAKKQFGDEYLSHCQIVPVEGGFAIQTEEVKTFPAPGEVEQIGSNMQLIHSGESEAFNPAVEAPHEAVAEESAPASTPALPAFLLEAPQPQAPVPAEAAAALAAGDAAANAALTENPFNNTVCPVCQSEELYTGRVDERGVVVDEDKMIGCHHCDWVVVLDDAAAAKVKTDAKRPRISTAEKPTKKVWAVADSMPGAKRKDVIEACVAQGIAYGTARTQYQHWFKCKADSAVAPIATIGADGKIVPPAAK